MQSDSRTARSANRSATAPVVQVARELQQPLEHLARTLGQPPARIVNQALAEYLERRLRPDREPSGSTCVLSSR